MFAAAKEITNVRNRYSIKLKLINPQSRRVQVKDRQGIALGEMTVRTRTIYPPKRKRQRLNVNSH